MRPLRKNFTSNFSYPDNYFSELSSYIKKYPLDQLAALDYLRFLGVLSLDKNYDEFYDYIISNKESFDDIYMRALRERVRYLIFKKKNIVDSQLIIKELMSLDKNQPIWIYYFNNSVNGYFEEVYNNVFYTAIPKNASTTLKNHIIKNVKKSSGKINPHSVFGNPYFSANLDVLKKAKSGAGLRLGVIRDPVARFASYITKNVLEEDSLNLEILGKKLAKPHFTFMYGLPTQPNIEEAIDNYLDYCYLYNDFLHHTLPQEAYFGSIFDYDMICDVPNIERLIEYVKPYLGDVTAPAPSREMSSSSIPNYTLGTKCKIKKQFSDDYAFLKKVASYNNSIVSGSFVNNFSLLDSHA